LKKEEDRAFKLYEKITKPKLIKAVIDQCIENKANILASMDSGCIMMFA
jgi:hypothetical protein